MVYLISSRWQWDRSKPNNGNHINQYKVDYPEDMEKLPKPGTGFDGSEVKVLSTGKDFTLGEKWWEKKSPVFEVSGSSDDLRLDITM